MKIVILNDTSYEYHHGCETVIKNIKKLALKNYMEVIDTNPVSINWKNNQSFLSNISKCDLVLVNGEGTLHHAQLTARELITVAKYVKENINIPVVLINSTYQDNSDSMAEYMKYFDLVYVRETSSKNELERYGIQSRVVPDMSFYSKFNLSNKVISSYIGVSDSVHAKLSEKLFELSLEKKYEYLPILTNPKIGLNSVKNILRFVKYGFFKRIVFLLPRLGYKPNYKATRVSYYIDDYQDYIQKISSLNFLIVARYHSLCFSLKTLTPFMAIELNSFRMSGMLEDVGIGIDRIIDGQDLSQLQINKLSKDEVDKISEYVNKAPLKIELMFNEIRKLLDK
jgi:polysaccharide pyruvyl transferase WcaK-like protein